MASTMEEITIKEVQIEALTVMKIVKHCATRAPATATGFVVGMDQANGSLEATNAFPFPVIDLPADAQVYEQQQHFNSAAAAPRAKANTSYQTEMIRMQKEVNVDANCVGWYTSSNMGNFINSNFIENQYYYQKEANERTVALVHDVSRTSQGGLSLRAFRLSAQFMAAYKEGNFTTEKLQKSGLKYTDILTEIPVRLHNSHLITTFLNRIPSSLLNRNTVDAASTDSNALTPPTSLNSLMSNPAITTDTLAPNFDGLSLSIDPFLASTCDSLLESIEAHQVEANNFSYYSRALAREQSKIAQWQAKRKAENAQRAVSKQPALPEDEWQKLFKLPQEPSRLESMLNSKQVDQYARQVDGFVAGTTGKMFAVRGNLIPGDLSLPIDDN